jgi:hypothetical protein
MVDGKWRVTGGRVLAWRRVGSGVALRMRCTDVTAIPHVTPEILVSKAAGVNRYRLPIAIRYKI